MSEKRKPTFILLLKKSGKKTNKVEVFRKDLWLGPDERDYWRIRVNGKWWPSNERKFITKTELKELFFRAI